MIVQEAWPRGNILFFAITDPWYLKCYELRTHGPKFLQLFWTNTWGQVCYKFQMFHALSITLPLWTRDFAWHRRTGLDKNLVKHRTQLRSRGVELVKVGELIHWKHQQLEFPLIREPKQFSRHWVSWSGSLEVLKTFRNPEDFTYLMLLVLNRDCLFLLDCFWTSLS